MALPLVDRIRGALSRRDQQMIGADAAAITRAVEAPAKPKKLGSTQVYDAYLHRGDPSFTGPKVDFMPRKLFDGKGKAVTFGLGSGRPKAA